MKRKILAAALCAACFLTACGGSSASTASSQAAPASSAAASSEAAPASSAASSESVSSAAAESASAASSQAEAEDPAKIAADLAANYNTAEELSGSFMEADESQSYTEQDMYEYVLVTDKRFGSAGEIKSFLADNFTQKMIDENYSYVFDEKVPQYVDVTGKDGLPDGLYMLNGGKGIFTLETEGIEIQDQTDSSFTAIVPYDEFGTEKKATVAIVRDDGKWKIDSVDMND